MLDMSELLCNRSVLALVNGVPWDMHRPLEDNCELKFLHFKDQDPDHCNRVGLF
jgi:large subunit ribosomal protein L39